MAISTPIRIAMVSAAFVVGACGSSDANDLFATPVTNSDLGTTDAQSEGSIPYSASEGSTSPVPSGALVDASGDHDPSDPGDADSGTSLNGEMDGARTDAPPTSTDGAVDPERPDRQECGSACEDKRVFVTSNAVDNGGFGAGSIAPADAFCQASADDRRLGGTWKAWISNAAESPATRFTRITAPYRLLDGTIVAMGWAGLTSGTLLHGIDMMDSLTTVPHSALLEVWTGTTPQGTTSDITCADWTNDSPSLPYGDVGTVGRVDSGWTEAYRQFCHFPNIHLYCFEQ